MQHLAALDQQFLNNPLSAWATAGAIAAGVGLLLFIVKHFLGLRLKTLAARTTTQIDDVVADLLGRTRYDFILALSIRAGSVALSLSDRAHDVLLKLVGVVVLLQVARWGNGLISFWLKRWSRQRDGDASSSSTINAIGVLARAVIWAIVILLALRNVLDYDITTLVTGLGISGIAIALAVQNILGDLFAALSIVLDKPFDVGDTIAVDTFTGTVEHIGLKTTRVRSVTGEQVIFGNSDLLRSRVRNLKRMVERRSLFSIGITYDTPPDTVARIPAMVREIITSTPNTRFERAHFARFLDSSLEFEIVYHITSSDYAVYVETQQAVNLGLLRRFNDEQIQFAFPTQKVSRVGDVPRGGADTLLPA